MAKTLVANRVKVTNVSIGIDDAGQVNSLLATVEVNYGTVGQREDVQLIDSLTATQKTNLQSIANKVNTAINATYL
jgi:hypothetical protein